MGAVDDARVIPALQRLTLDPSFTVRQQAMNSLRALGFMKTAEKEAAAMILHGRLQEVQGEVQGVDASGITSLRSLT
jgi:HEAT repeat protein